MLVETQSQEMAAAQLICLGVWSASQVLCLVM